MAPDLEKRPKKFHLAADGDALKALAERIRELLRRLTLISE